MSDPNLAYNLKEFEKLCIDSRFRVRLTEKFGPVFYELVVGEK